MSLKTWAVMLKFHFSSLAANFQYICFIDIKIVQMIY